MSDLLSIVVVGEINSGKSTLIGRFLFEMHAFSYSTISELKNICKRLNHDFEFAYFLDSFEEERRGEFTIDTTQVFCKTKKDSGFLFIDVPGHQQLFKNMLCGSSYADMAIVVIDVKKCLEKGTKRHIDTLRFLEIDKIIIALNKMDTVGFSKKTFQDAKERINKYLEGVGVKSDFFIPISAQQGDNIIRKSTRMPWYNGLSVYETINIFKRRYIKKEKQGFYFPIQDIYLLDGYKLVVGPILSGEIKKGQHLMASPLGEEFKVKAIRGFNKFKTSAKANESVGLLLDKVGNLKRGQILSKGDSLEVTNEIEAKIFCTQSVNQNETFILKSLTQTTSARITQIKMARNAGNIRLAVDSNNLIEQDIAKVTIRVKDQIAIKKFRQFHSLGRFVLLNNAGICAVGIIV